jgi:hypothetical protein
MSKPPHKDDIPPPPTDDDIPPPPPREQSKRQGLLIASTSSLLASPTLTPQPLVVTTKSKLLDFLERQKKKATTVTLTSKEGYLVKLGGSLRWPKWQKRFFMTKGTKMYYYKTDADKKVRKPSLLSISSSYSCHAFCCSVSSS